MHNNRHVTQFPGMCLLGTSAQQTEVQITTKVFLEVQFAAGGRQIAPTFTFIDFKEQDKTHMEVNFAAGGRRFSPTFTFIDFPYWK